jgi:hypothetical protein
VVHPPPGWGAAGPAARAVSKIEAAARSQSMSA